MVWFNVADTIIETPDQLLERGVIVRAVSSEISGGKFPEIYSNLSGNFRNFVEDFFSRYTF